MSRSVKLSIAMIGAAALVLVRFLIFTGGEDQHSPEVSLTSGSAELLVRDDSSRLTGSDEAVFVECLDFGCEACQTLYPVIEDLREEYGDRVTFVVRHMPLHGDSVNAASQRETFFGYAEGLSLDMDRFTAAHDDPATMERIEQSQQEGQAWGISGTPTFFLDGELLQPQSVTDLEDAFDLALQDWPHRWQHEPGSPDGSSVETRARGAAARR